MAFINWGSESPEQLKLRKRLEEEAIFEQRAAAMSAAAAAAAGSGRISSATVYYVRSNESEPWEENTNINEMNQVFGEKGWSSAFFETIDVDKVFSPKTTYVFIDGSNIADIIFISFMEGNWSQIQQWVEAGGRLFLNCAPNNLDAGLYELGINGAELVSENFTDSAVIAEGKENHPIFLGPGDPGTAWTGDSFGHAYLYVSGDPLIVNSEEPGTVCSELTLENGIVIFGGMTTTNFHDPQPQATYLRQNIHAYLSGNSYTPQLGALTMSEETERRSSRR